MWAAHMKSQFAQYEDDDGVEVFGNLVIRQVQRRAGNQLVNAFVQGTCATLAKRSILRINEQIEKQGFRARFKLPIHDELVFSVHRDEVVEFLRMAKGIMCNHPDIIQTLQVDGSASIGLTFEPFHPKKAPVGQVEIDELPPLPFLSADRHWKVATESEVRQVVDYLFEKREQI